MVQQICSIAGCGIFCPIGSHQRQANLALVRCHHINKNGAGATCPISAIDSCDIRQISSIYCRNMDLCDSPIDWVPFENFSFPIRLHTQNLELLAVFVNYFFHNIDIRLHCFHPGNRFLIPFGGRYIIPSQKPELWLDIILNIKFYIPYVIPALLLFRLDFCIQQLLYCQ